MENSTNHNIPQKIDVLLSDYLDWMERCHLNKMAINSAVCNEAARHVRGQLLEKPKQASTMQKIEVDQREKELPKTNKSNLQSHSLYAVPVASVPSPAKAVKIPEDYECAITHEIMKNPMFCTLDGISYEEAAIREWLAKHRTSPSTRKAMKADDTVDDVLMKNINLKNAIDKFKEENPQLFIEERLTL